MFARQDMSEGELIDDIECLGGLELLSDRPPIAVKKSLIYTFRYAEQETKLRAGIDCCRTDTMKHFGEIIALDEVAHEVQIKVGPGREIPPRFSIGPKGPININAVRDAVWRFADALLKGGDRFAAIGQFLRKVPPRLEGRPAGSPIVTASSGDLPDRGIFLGTTWRMHGDICRFISDAVYDGRLEPEKANSEQRLVLDPRTTHSAPRATGIRFVPVVHEGCAQKSDEEAQVVREILQSLLAQRVRSKQGHGRGSGLSTSSKASRPKSSSFPLPPPAGITCPEISSSSTARTGSMWQCPGQNVLRSLSRVRRFSACAATASRRSSW